ncbi:MAG: HIT family protein [Desulfuromonas sp.]|nr:MAG: HIT family protein [Desulfuromonas sp.]
MASNFTLNQQLAEDCIVLGSLGSSLLLLLNNSLVPWFILVPQTEACEIHDMPDNERLQLFDEMMELARFVDNEFKPDKVNTGAIGNIVRQLHVHVIARYEDDFCWPQVVWGRPEKKLYSTKEIDRIMTRLSTRLKQRFVPVTAE